MTHRFHAPPKQRRSRATLERLLRAAEQVIAERGVAELTVQEVAERAGVAVGTLYGRFPNKDAFLREFAADFHARARATTDRAFAPERCVGLDARGLVGRVTRLLVGSYRAHRGLLRALYLYARTRTDGPLPGEGAAFDADFVERLTGLFLERRAELACPRPERAVVVGLLMVDGAAKEAVLFGDRRTGRLAVSDDELVAELSSAWAAYLGIRAPQ
jgi:AcrR family transcriptional regulator